MQSSLTGRCMPKTCLERRERQRVSSQCTTAIRAQNLRLQVASNGNGNEFVRMRLMAEHLPSAPVWGANMHESRWHKLSPSGIVRIVVNEGRLKNHDPEQSGNGA